MTELWASRSKNGAASALLLHFVVVWIGIVALPAQRYPAPDRLPDDRHFSVTGTVINALTGEPIPRALVSVGPRSTLSDLQGRFHIADLEYSRLPITARKPGFSDPQEQPWMPKQFASPNMGAVTLKLTPNAVISGRVLDQDDEPVAHVNLTLLVRNVVDGRAVWSPAGGSSSDDEGTFRLANLQPGRYYLRTVGVRVYGSVGGAPVRQMGFGMVFYPGVLTREEAEMISLTAGEHRELSFKLHPQPIFQVAGMLRGAPPNSGVVVMMDGSFASAFIPATGQFRFVAVPAGSHTLRANWMENNAAYYAEAKITVERDLTDLVLTGEQALSLPIAVSVLAEDAAVPVPEHPETLLYSLRLLPSTNTQDGEQRQFNPEGPTPTEGKPTELKFRGVTQGSYILEGQTSPPWYVVQAHYGSADLLNESFKVAGDRANPVEVTLKNDSATLSVNVSPAQDAQPTLLLISEDVPMRKPEVRAVMPNSEGSVTATFLGVAPGSYELYAFDSIAGLEYANPDVLSAYGSSAQNITLAPRQKLTVNATIIKRMQ